MLNSLSTPNNNIENIGLNKNPELQVDKKIDEIAKNIKIDNSEDKAIIKEILKKILPKINKKHDSTKLNKFGTVFQTVFDGLKIEGMEPYIVLDQMQDPKKFTLLREFMDKVGNKPHINNKEKKQIDYNKITSEVSSEISLDKKQERKNKINEIETEVNNYESKNSLPNNREEKITPETKEIIRKELTKTYNDENLTKEEIETKTNIILKAQVIAQQIADKMANPPAGYTPSVEEIKFLENINKLNQSLGIDEITQNEKPGKSAHIKSLESINEDSNSNFSAELKETNTDIKNDYIEDKDVKVLNKESLKETIGNNMNDSIIEKIGIIKAPKIKEEISSILNQVSSKNPNAKLNPKDIMDNYFDNISFNNDGDLQIKESDSSNLNTLFGKISDLNIYKFKVLSERKSY